MRSLNRAGGGGRRKQVAGPPGGGMGGPPTCYPSAVADRNLGGRRNLGVGRARHPHFEDPVLVGGLDVVGGHRLGDRDASSPPASTGCSGPRASGPSEPRFGLLGQTHSLSASSARSAESASTGSSSSVAATSSTFSPSTALATTGTARTEPSISSHPNPWEFCRIRSRIPTRSTSGERRSLEV